jgi:hypothetical protein
MASTTFRQNSVHLHHWRWAFIISPCWILKGLIHLWNEPTDTHLSILESNSILFVLKFQIQCTNLWNDAWARFIISRVFLSRKAKCQILNAASGVNVSLGKETPFHGGSEMTELGLSLCPLYPVRSVFAPLIRGWCFALAQKRIIYFNADLWCFIHILNLLSPVAPVRVSLLSVFFLIGIDSLFCQRVRKPPALLAWLQRLWLLFSSLQKSYL